MTGKKTTTLMLNANGVIAPLHKILEECTRSILFGLQTMELVNEIPPYLGIEEGFLSFQFGKDKDDEDIVLKKEKYRAWLVKKGFEDLVKGIEHALREAYLYISIFSKSSKLKTVKDLEQILPSIKQQALKMHIPTMLQRIEPHLEKPWSYKKQILSINKARTCLVHRNGLVTEKDINDETKKTLRLEWTKHKIFYEKNGEEIEIVGKTAIDGGTQVKLRRENNTINFKQGNHITLNYKQFNEFIITCFHFGADLVDCLPKKIK